MSSESSAIFLGSPNVSRPPVVACSVRHRHEERVLALDVAVAGPDPEPAGPERGEPGAHVDHGDPEPGGGVGGSSGRGRTAAMASGSVSKTTVTAFDQIGLLVASTSRLVTCSGGRAPYRTFPMTTPSPGGTPLPPRPVLHGGRRPRSAQRPR